ncbi:hypothetical protein HDEF_0161 [Candidatus Hamiltonella defensa 5AT (Acyrthosiphon pisum)]|uniref:Uncharacterized protein n=1 Tax=Hamiltonella defensa subsp. Acyrthosiphon pisum (strain 5AT) TaxID=572265 RepID=C4K8U7_HAMD5|nr:hypothetical protein HDEF_0161 [Candidatus Hamiltonella defensa 5AT (Acyrthosiphon pisum)]
MSETQTKYHFDLTAKAKNPDNSKKKRRQISVPGIKARKHIFFENINFQCH